MMKHPKILEAIIKALREKQIVSKRKLAPLHKEQAKLKVQQAKVSKKITEGEGYIAAVSEDAIKKYKIAWQALPDNAASRCPICVSTKHKNIPLKPVGDGEREWLSCPECRETFELSVND